MIILVFCIGIAFVIALSVVLLVVLVNNAAENKQQASFVKENTIEYAVTGENYWKTLPNVDGRILTTDGKLLSESEMKAQFKEKAHIGFIANWLREKWGFYWVSFFYPWRKIHKFPIIKERLKGTAEIGPNTKIRDMIERDSKPSVVDHVRAQISRPFAVEGIETKENFSVDLLISGMFEFIDGRPLAFTYQERFYEVLKSAVEGAANDYMRDLDYKEFRKSEKGKESVFSKAMIERLNSLVEHLGVRVIDIWIETYKLVSGDDVEKATRALEVAELNGTAKVKESEFNLQAAENDASALVLPIKKKIEAWGNAVLANRDVVTENLSKGSIGTLVMGTENVITTLPIGGGSGGLPSTPRTPPTPPPGP